MRPALFILVLVLLGCETSPSDRMYLGNGQQFNNDQFMTVEELRGILKAKKSSGQRLIGYGRTVFEGTRIETFEVDFLDVVLFGGFVKRPIFL